MSTDPRDVIIPAADFSSRDDVMRFLEAVPDVRWVKLGMEILAAEGPSIIDELVDDFKVFVDAKIVDIPKTMAATAKIHAARRPAMLNCMAHGGVEGMRGVADACRANGVMSVAVTVLTSQDPADCIQEHRRAPRTQVDRVYGPNAAEAGIDTILCSPWELRTLAEHPVLSQKGKITPGIRPPWAAPDGQTRFMTPFQAVRLGADFLVVGSPITSEQYGTPADNYARLLDEVAAAA